LYGLILSYNIKCQPPKTEEISAGDYQVGTASEQERLLAVEKSVFFRIRKTRRIFPPGLMLILEAFQQREIGNPFCEPGHLLQ
jgi:hypothetical protein